MKHPRRKKSLRIGEAIFRGRRSQYIFEVFPLTAEINDTPAIFVISRRVTDKFRKGHHATVCLGETASIAGEIKKHKRAKCVKQNAANVVCILKENNEAKRSSVVDDLKAARMFNCVRNADQPNTKIRLNVSTRRSRPGNTTFAPTEVKIAAPTRSGTKRSQPVKPVAKRAEAKKAQPVKTKKSKPAKTEKSKPIKTVASKTIKQKVIRKPAPAAKSKPDAKVKQVKNKKSSSVAAASTHRTCKRPISAAKLKDASPKRKTAAAKRPAAKPARTPKTRSQVPTSTDSKRGQHRPSRSKKSVDRRAKSRTVGKSRSRQKAAA
jgi:hypothetical protein